MRHTASIGGQAAAQGIAYEERTAAWCIAQLLAETSLDRLGGTSDWRSTAVWMQAPVAAGDVVIEHSGQGAIYVQARFRKDSVAVNAKPGGLLVDVLSQFARQFCGQAGPDVAGAAPWSRSFNVSRDRFALVVPTSAGSALAPRAASLLARFREPGGWQESPQRFNAAEVELIEILRDSASVALRAAGAVDLPVDSFLGTIQIVALDLEDRDAGPAEARSLLENAVLAPADHARGKDAWRALVELAGGANRGVQRITFADAAAKLQAEGLRLRTPRSFARSIQRLQEITRTNLARLKRYAELRIATDQSIEIPRRCADALLASLQGNRVVIGRPGAGKSGVIYQVCDRLHREQQDVVLLLADDLQATSDQPLHQVLGLDAELPAVLAAWHGTGTAHLVIDALDAARDARVAHKLRVSMDSVIAESSRWRVLASVRQFDLKHSPETRDLFAGTPVVGYTESEFRDTAHFAVPKLDDDELAYAAGRHASVRELITVARHHEASYDLLKQPFNLAIACELLRGQVSVSNIVPFDTNTALLDRFWNKRIMDSAARGAQREAVMAGMVEQLVSRLAMRIRDDRESDRSVVAELLERNVLDASAFEDGEIRFSHHLFHDYAVSRLLFRSHQADNLVARLTAQPDLALYARQSLLLYFDHLWAKDPTRATFWNTALVVLRSDQLPLVARILGTESAVGNVTEWVDFGPLLERVQAGAAGALQMLQFCIGDFLDVEGDQLGRVVPAWIRLAVHLGGHVPSCLWQVHLLLFKMVPDRGVAPSAIAAEANLAARLLAAGILARPKAEDRTGPDYLTAMRVLCQTASAAPVETEAALRPLLTPAFAQANGDRVYWVVADKIKEISRVLPEWALDFHVVVFGQEFTDEGWEPLGQSKIVPMQVRRRDNYEMARHRLKDEFPAFFEASPLLATKAVLRFLPAYRLREHARRSGQRDVRRSFRFRDRRCHLIEDLSSIWASDSSSREEDAIAMLRVARNGWIALAESGRDHELAAILDIIAKEAELAVIWREVLSAGERSPRVFGPHVRPLLTERAILTGMDTHHPAASLLEISFPLCRKAERMRIERAILRLPKARWKDHAGKVTVQDTHRGLFLNQLNPRHLVTAQAKVLRKKLLESKELRRNVPPFSSRSTTGQIEWADFVPELQGVDLETPGHRAAREWEQKLTALSRGEGKKITADTFANAWLQLGEAHRFVTDPPPGVHPAAAGIVWAQVVSLGEIIVHAGLVPPEAEKRAFLRGLLLRAATDPKPVPGETSEADFARMASWGSPNPRIDAAEALIIWPRQTRSTDDEIRDALRRLAADPHPAVRFQIAGSCNALYQQDRSLMWELIHTRTAAEQNPGVWMGWLRAVDHIASGHQDEAADIFFEALRRFPGNEESRRDPAEYAIGGLGDLYIRFGHSRATSFILGLANNPAPQAHHLSRLCHGFRNTLALGLRPDAPAPQRELHRRGLDFFLPLARSAGVALEAFVARTGGPTPPTTEEVREMLQLLDAICMQVYFSSGAYDRKTGGDDHVPPPAPEDFWRENRPLIEELARLPSTHIAYHLVQTLEHLVPAAPADIFRCLVQVVANARADGFAREHLAVGVIARIVERYLADYPDLFTSNPGLMQGLLQVLDSFAEVGWPEARRLIRNLSRLYR